MTIFTKRFYALIFTCCFLIHFSCSKEQFENNTSNEVDNFESKAFQKILENELKNYAASDRKKLFKDLKTYIDTYNNSSQKTSILTLDNLTDNFLFRLFSDFFGDFFGRLHSDRYAFDYNSHNPIISKKGLADPCVIKHNGKYYLYPTSNGREYRVYESDNLYDWIDKGVAFSSDKPNVWAPDVYKHTDGMFYLYYSVNFKVGVAKSSTPFGPFIDHGVIASGIDAHLFRDPKDQNLYLYYTNYDNGPYATNDMVVRKMKNPLKVDSKEFFIMRADKKWENGPLMIPFGITEAPTVVYKEEFDLYYLIYSGDFYFNNGYATGYATSNSPLGPFKKYEKNPFLSQIHTDVMGPGHASYLKGYDGNEYLFYHQKSTPKWTFTNENDTRYIVVDKIKFDANGILKISPNALNPSKM